MLVRLVYIVSGIVFVLITGGCQPLSSPENLQATWDRAVISIPTDVLGDGYYCNGPQNAPAMQKCLEAMPDKGSHKAILFLHGCSGMNIDHVSAMRDLGAVVFAPNSLAIPGRPVNCDVGAAKEHIARLRLSEANFALGKMRNINWIDTDSIILAGFSEGGVTTALYNGNDVSGKIIFGWSCTSKNSFYDGIRGPSDIPVLAITGGEDRYLKNRVTSGRCGPFSNPESRSIVLPGVGHNVINEPETIEALKRFLTARW